MNNFRIDRFADKLATTALKSYNQHKHAAVLVYNKTPVAWGFNTIVGNDTRHAEQVVIQQFLASRGYYRFRQKPGFLQQAT